VSAPAAPSAAFLLALQKLAPQQSPAAAIAPASAAGASSAGVSSRPARSRRCRRPRSRAPRPKRPGRARRPPPRASPAAPAAYRAGGVRRNQAEQLGLGGLRASRVPAAPVAPGARWAGFLKRFVPRGLSASAAALLLIVTAARPAALAAMRSKISGSLAVLGGGHHSSHCPVRQCIAPSSATRGTVKRQCWSAIAGGRCAPRPLQATPASRAMASHRAKVSRSCSPGAAPAASRPRSWAGRGLPAFARCAAPGFAVQPFKGLPELASIWPRSAYWVVSSSAACVAAVE
jgi:hypothetical protein